jgi:hypothetical protein
MVEARARTARYSRIRSFTFSRPWWSSSRIVAASLMSNRSSVATFQGSPMSQST